MKVDQNECKSTCIGVEYAGKVAQTAYGEQCQRWSLHTTSNFEFPEKDVTLANSYCRNVKLDRHDDPMVPWCYINKPWKFNYCNIPYCSNVTVNNQECRTTADGFDYAGTMSRTIDGYQCQKWIDQSTYMGNDNYKFPENNVTAANNYCRYVDSRGMHGLWFYTKDPDVRWQLCLIPMCTDELPHGIHDECKKDRQGLEYQGRVSHTKDGNVCMPWTAGACHKYSHDVFDSNDYDILAVGKRSIHSSASEEHNYCRNTDNSIEGTWCFNKSCSVERCGIPICGISK